MSDYKALANSLKMIMHKAHEQNDNNEIIIRYCKLTTNR